jgi:hypothetical protein
MSRISTQATYYRTGAQAITTSDATNLATPAVGLFVGGAGNISAVMESGDVVTFTGVLAGSFLPFVFSRINATGTTATNMVGGK